MHGYESRAVFSTDAYALANWQRIREMNSEREEPRNLSSCDPHSWNEGWRVWLAWSSIGRSASEMKICPNMAS